MLLPTTRLAVRSLYSLWRFLMAGKKSLFPKAPTLKKVLGITQAKRSIAKVTGVPTTSEGRNRKVKKLFGI